MDALTFVAVLLVVGTVNVGLALNFVSRRADRNLRRYECYDRTNAAHADRELKRKVFNVEHARALMLSSAAPAVTADQAALIKSGA